jgi:hypothetical protein
MMFLPLWLIKRGRASLQAAAPAKKIGQVKMPMGTGCPLMRKLGTFGHGGQLTVEYQLLVSAQV